MNFMNDIRFATVFAVLVFHAALCFTPGAPAWWYFSFRHESFAAGLFVIAADVCMMPILFFISGYFAEKSLFSRGRKNFIMRKLTRLGIPWVVFSLTAAPFLAYRSALNCGYKNGFAAFIAGEFWGKFYSQGPYWFLGILLLFSCVFALSRPRRGPIPAGLVWCCVFLVSAAGMFGGVMLCGADAWFSLRPLLVFQPARIAGYAVYFWAGTRACSDHWFRGDGSRKTILASAAFTAVLCLLWIAVKIRYPAPDNAFQAFVYSLSDSAFCISAALFLWAYGNFRLKKGDAAIFPKSISAGSFTLYLLHLPLIVLSAPLVAGYVIGAAARFAVLVTGVFSLCFITDVIYSRLKRGRKFIRVKGEL